MTHQPKDQPLTDQPDTWGAGENPKFKIPGHRSDEDNMTTLPNWTRTNEPRPASSPKRKSLMDRATREGVDFERS